MKILNFLLLIGVLLLDSACENKKVVKKNVIGSIVPEPAEMVPMAGQFHIDEQTVILAEEGNKEAEHIARMFVEKFQTASGTSLTLQTATKQKKNSIFFTTQNSDNSLNKEGYELEVGPHGIVVKASEGAGLFYGMQTILSLLPPEIHSIKALEDIQWTVPAVKIKDEPRFSWRGLHLDVGRHFMPAEFIKKYIDFMAMHKMNTFHWHLTDDQGWRIEIKQYPKLTEIGAWRNETLIGRADERPQKFDGKRYGGYYTQEEVKEIVKYAADRFIVVVPEIEMPGHASAAVAAYPYLGVTGEQIDVVTSWGVFPDIYNITDETFNFLENVLTEVIELFPSEYIHIGGDEAMKDHWKASSYVQNKMKDLGVKDEHELQSYFITRIEKFLNMKGRQIIGWDEILEGGLAPNAALMSWRGEEGGIAAAKNMHKVVMSPASHMYFDYYQGDPEFEPLAFGGYITLEKVYSYEPVPDTLSQEEAKYIMGAQANMWTEYMRSTDHVEYMLFPRISALSEVLWTKKENKNWDKFKGKLGTQLKRYDFQNINYAKSIFRVSMKEDFDSVSNKLRVKFENQLGFPDMAYSLDSDLLAENFKIYTGPLLIEKGTTIQAAILKDSMPHEEVTVKKIIFNDTVPAGQ